MNLALAIIYLGVRDGTAKKTRKDLVKKKEPEGNVGTLEHKYARFLMTSNEPDG